MSYALSSGVTGLQAHQEMLDVAGNNLANVNTTAFKASRVGFAELLSQTLEQASQPTDRVGGTNPQQMGSGVGVAEHHAEHGPGQYRQYRQSPGRRPSRAKGTSSSATATAQLYTRAGAFGVDAERLPGGSRHGLPRAAHRPDGRERRLPDRRETATSASPTASPCRPRRPPRSPHRQPQLRRRRDREGPGAGVEHDLHGRTARKPLGTAQIDQLDQFSRRFRRGRPVGRRPDGHHHHLRASQRDGTAFSAGLTFTVTGDHDGQRPGQPPEHQRADRRHGLLRERPDPHHGR